MGRGLGEQRGAHKRRNELQESDAELKDAREAGKMVKGLVVRCHATKSAFAHVIPSKGSLEDTYVVDLVCSDVAWLGHVKLILKGDNERVLVTLINQALKVLRCQVEELESISAEHSQPYDSQSNGGTEVGIRAVRRLFRTLKL